MQIYSKEFKLKVIKEYLEGTNGGYLKLCKKYGISDTKTLRTWVDKYKIHGETAFDNIVIFSKDTQNALNEITLLRKENKELRKRIEEIETKERSKTNE